MDRLDLFKREDLIDQYAIYPLLVVKNLTSDFTNQINKINQNYNSRTCIHNSMIRWFKYWLDNFNIDYALPNLKSFFSKIEANNNDYFLPNCGITCDKTFLDEEEQNALIAAAVFYMCLKQENIKYDKLQQENKLIVMRNFNDFMSEYIDDSYLHFFLYEKFCYFDINSPIDYLFSFHATSFIAYVTAVKKNGFAWNQNNDKYFHQKIDLNLNEINCNSKFFTSLESEAIQLIIKCNKFKENNLEIAAQEINNSNINTNTVSIFQSNQFPINFTTTGSTANNFSINTTITNDYQSQQGISQINDTQNLVFNSNISSSEPTYTNVLTAPQNLDQLNEDSNSSKESICSSPRAVFKTNKPSKKRTRKN
jgi:hypothetical protein